MAPGESTASSNIDERAADDANHAVKKAISLDLDLQPSRVATRSSHLGAYDVPHRILAFIRCGTEGTKVVHTDQRQRLLLHQRLVQPLAHSPSSLCEERIAKLALEHDVTVRLAQRVMPRIEASFHTRSARHADLGSADAS